MIINNILNININLFIFNICKLLSNSGNLVNLLLRQFNIFKY